jgi:hypothetical protein
MSQPQSIILDAERRAWAYWFADGLPTLTAGVGSLSIAFFLLYSRHRAATPLSVGVLLIALGLYGAILLRHRQIVEWLKSKITYPRTGYASPPYFTDDTTLPVDFIALSLQGADAKWAKDIDRVQKDRKRQMIFTVAMVLVATLGMMFIANRWICGAAGVAIAAALWMGVRKDERLSWIVLAGFPFIGFYMTVFMANHVVGPDRVAYFLAGSGMLFLLDGAVALIRYLRRNPGTARSQA